MRSAQRSIGSNVGLEGSVLEALSSAPALSPSDGSDTVAGETRAQAMAREAMEQHRQLLDRVHGDLHDLCQPLTALQCRLEVGRLLGDTASMLEALEGGLQEAGRLFEVVVRMRMTLQQGDAVERGWALRASLEQGADAPR